MFKVCNEKYIIKNKLRSDELHLSLRRPIPLPKTNPNKLSI